MKDIALRVGAVFILGALGTIGAAAVLGIPPLIGAGIAGMIAAKDVLADLAKAFLDDGKITKQELNEVFSDAVKRVKKEEK